MNNDGRGIKSGLNTCTCNDLLQCTCGVDSFLQGNHVSGTTRERRLGTGKLRNQENEIVVSGARKGWSFFSLFSLPQKLFALSNNKSQRRLIESKYNCCVNIRNFEYQNLKLNLNI